MTSLIPLYCLALYPISGAGPRNVPALISALTALGLVGEPLAGGQDRYRLGERFYQYLTFMGCAPALRLEPAGPGDRKFSHFRLVETGQAEFRYLRPESKGRCPHCRKPSGTVVEIQQTCFTDGRDWTCPHCQTVSPAQALNWKHEAGVGAWFLELLDIYPHEVVPTDMLLSELQTQSGVAWDYFYTTATL